MTAHWEPWPFFTPEERVEAEARMNDYAPGVNYEPIPLETRREVFARDGNQCVRCSRVNQKVPGRRKVLFTLDHIVPRCEGGSNDPENLRVLCWPCHSARNRGLWS